MLEIEGDSGARFGNDMGGGDVGGGPCDLRGDSGNIGAGAVGDRFDRLSGFVASALAIALRFFLGIRSGGIGSRVIAMPMFPRFDAGPGMCRIVGRIGRMLQCGGQASSCVGGHGSARIGKSLGRAQRLFK